MRWLWFWAVRAGPGGRGTGVAETGKRDVREEKETQKRKKIENDRKQMRKTDITGTNFVEEKYAFSGEQQHRNDVFRVNDF